MGSQRHAMEEPTRRSPTHRRKAQKDVVPGIQSLGLRGSARSTAFAWTRVGVRYQQRVIHVLRFYTYYIWSVCAYIYIYICKSSCRDVGCILIQISRMQVCIYIYIMTAKSGAIRSLSLYIYIYIQPPPPPYIPTTHVVEPFVGRYIYKYYGFAIFLIQKYQRPYVFHSCGICTCCDYTCRSRGLDPLWNMYSARRCCMYIYIYIYAMHPCVVDLYIYTYIYM